MSQQLVQIQKKRLPEHIQEFVDILRSTRLPKCKRAYFDGEGGVCAMGAVRVGLGIMDKFGNYTFTRANGFAKFDKMTYDINNKLRESIAELNDGHDYSFPQMATIIEDAFSGDQ